MDARQQLLALARVYAAHRQLSLARIATLSVNHGGFFKRLEAGADFTVGSYERCLKWFAANWPAELAWPKDITRPAASAADGAAA